MSSFQQAVSIEQRGCLLGHWSLASDLPNPPVTGDCVEKAQPPMASATGGCGSERGDAQRGATQTPLRSKQRGFDRSGGTVFGWRGARAPADLFWVGHVERKAGRVKDGAREGAGERTRRPVRSVQLLPDEIGRSTKRSQGSRESSPAKGYECAWIASWRTR